MKKIFKKSMFMFFLIMLMIPVTFAKDNVFYTNYAGVEMTETEYNYMISNFDENLVKNMSQSLFESGLDDADNIELVSQEYKYIETTFNPSLMLTTEREITKEEYENYNPIMPLANCDYGVTCWETNAKRLSIQVYNNQENGYQAVTVENMWKTIPNVKSFDVIAVRWSSNNGYYPNIARMDGQQVYRQSTGTLTEHMYDIETQNTKVNSNRTAVGISMNIGDNAYQFLSNVIYLEFIVTRNVTLTFDATYQHATSNVTLAQSQDYTFGAGGLGNVLIYNSNTIKNKYDNMQGVSTMVAYIP